MIKEKLFSHLCSFWHLLEVGVEMLVALCHGSRVGKSESEKIATRITKQAKQRLFVGRMGKEMAGKYS